MKNNNNFKYLFILMLLIQYSCDLFYQPEESAIIPDIPVNITATVNSDNIIINWDFSNNSNTYLVYKKVANQEWSLISESLTTNSFIELDIVYDTDIYYGVKSENNGTFSELGQIPVPINIVYIVKIPVLPQHVVAVVNEDNVTVNWDNNSINKHYMVFRKYDEKDWQPITELLVETKFVDYSFVWDTDVLYGVKGEINGLFSEIAEIQSSVISIPVPDIPGSVSAIINGNTVNINWTAVGNANNYMVLLKYDGGEWESVSGLISENSYIHNQGVIYDKDILYGVKSEYKGKFSSIGSISSTEIVVPTPAMPYSVNATLNGNVGTISWGDAEGTNQYRVFIKYDGEEWTPVSNLLTETSFIHTDVVLDKNLKYGVMSEYKGKYSEIKSMVNSVISVPYPDAPANVTAFIDGNNISISWTKVLNANNYKIFIKYDDNDWSPVSNYIVETSYIDTEVVYDKDIYYGVKSEYKGKESDLTSISQAVTVIPYPNLPTNVTATVNNASVTITWGLIINAESYKVYLKYSAGNWIPVSNWILANTFVDSSLNTDISVIYGVKANYKGKISEIATIPQNIILYHNPDTPQNVEATITDSSAQITWNDVSNAEKYEVLIRTEFGEWQSISSLITSNSYTHNNLIYDEKIYYGVRSEFTNNYSSIKSILIPIFTAHTPNDPTGVTATVNNTDISISWNSVTNADKYQVYRKAGNGDWISITGFINGTEYNDTSVIFDTTLYYGVQAEYSDNLSEIISIQDSVYLNHTPYNPLNVSVLTYSDHSELSWSAVSNANRYQVYRKDEGSIWTEISGLITETSYNDTSVVFDSDMIYGVRAEFNGKYSDISEYYTPVEITHTPDSVTSLTAFINYNDITLTWDEVSNAQNYYVYRKYGNGNWVVISYLQSESTFIDNSPIYDTNVYYGVTSEYIDKFSAITSLESPVQITSADITVSNLDAKSLYSTNGIYLSWSKLSDSVTYHIYRSEVDSSIGVEVGTTNNRNYFDQKSASNNILEDKIYYYKVLWSKSGSGIGGSLQTPVKGFFSNIIDTGEPDNSDRNNTMFNEDNISINQTITSVLYKHGTLADTDWFRYTVPGNSTHFINAHFLNFKNLGLVEIYKDNIFISENQFPLSDITLTNSSSEEDVFYIRVIPNNKITLEDFTEEYNLNITTSF